MRILPILFNTEMVRALLEERKSVTRRVLKPQPLFYTGRRYVFADDVCPKKWEDCDNILDTYQYQPGDILYVRETWAKLYYVDPDGYTHYDQPMYYYAADGTPDIILRDGDGFEEDDQRIRWRPSIHMPKEAARIFLRVTDVRVERVQDITEEQAKAEGAKPAFEYYTMDGPVITFDADGYFRTGYKALWNRLYAKPMPVKEHGVVVRYESYPWEDIQEVRTYRGLPWLVIGNPWVWVIGFERTYKPDGWPGAI